MKFFATVIVTALLPLSVFAAEQSSSVQQPTKAFNLEKIIAQPTSDAGAFCREPFYGDCSCVPTCGRQCHEIPAFCGAW